MSFSLDPAIITSEVTSLESINFHSYQPSSISTGLFVGDRSGSPVVEVSTETIWLGRYLQ
jgi:hypothetical protein